MYELLVIGAGPAGLAAGIYGARSGLRTAILDRNKAGGALFDVPLIDNYPGFENVSGQMLLEKMVNHARRYSEIIEFEEATDIVKDGDVFRVKTREREHLASAVVLTTGTSRKKLGVRGEAELLGRGVSYCPLCDGYMFRGRKAVVVGGGNTAVVDALFLRELGCEVTLVHRRDRLRAEEALVRRLGDVKLVLNSVVEEIVGEKSVEGIRIRNVVDGSTGLLEASAVFVSIGTVPNSQLAVRLGAKVDERGNVVADRFQRTDIGGFYAAGDVTGGVRQVVVACAEGAVAALSAFEDLRRPYWTRSSS
ncbi:MAG: FAD-dependent oxidoreductase [Candidatus Hadarchaeales archaeon]